MEKYDSVIDYINGQEKYTEALNVLRQLFLETEMEESMKWGMPTYCINTKNILGMAAFKQHFCIWFHQGALIKDDQNLLINAQKGKTRAMRQMRFTRLEDVDPSRVRNYVRQAIDNHNNGKEIKAVRSPKAMVIPEELEQLLKTDDGLHTAFYGLTPGRQREYCEYISTAKREATKQSRLEKIMPLILKGVGLNDKYKNC